MTLEEKAVQMVGVWTDKTGTLTDVAGAFDSQKACIAFKGGVRLGQVGRPSDAGGGLGPRRQAELTNAIQRFFLEQSLLGIPVFFHEECQYGLAAPGGTSFLQPIALAAIFDPDLIEALDAMTTLEAHLRGVHQALTPVGDVTRDPRWGRVEETFGEDPYLVGRLGVAAVRGFQGNTTFHDREHVIATLKHYAAHGRPESGMNCAPMNVSERVLREVFFPPFLEALLEGGSLSVIASYNEIDGVPSHANRWLLRSILREKWGFNGFLVSGYYAICELYDRPDTHSHHVAADKKQAAALAVKAGVNVESPEPDAYRHLVELVREGTLQGADLRWLVLPMHRLKFRMGLFDAPYVDPDPAERVVISPEHASLARGAAEQAITLLKNDGPVLPLNASALARIAVIGPHANHSLLRGYSGKPPYEMTVLQGIQEKLGDTVKIVYHEGCKITVGGSWQEDPVVPSTPQEDHHQIAEAAEVVQDADIIILAIGGNEQTSRESWALNHMGHRADLRLIGRQQELVDAIGATGKPVVVLLFNGRPLAINEVDETVPAISECWYLGQEAGHAVADVLFGDVLFGDVNPGGKMPISVSRSVGHIPAYYNHTPFERRGYLFDEVTPLHAFGYGLSYTTFELMNLCVDEVKISRDGHTQVQIDVTNTGDLIGTETVQFCVHDRTSSVTRAVKELKGFARIELQPDETQTVSFDVTPNALAFWDIAKNYVVEPGDFDLLVGTSSRDADLQWVALRVTA